MAKVTEIKGERECSFYWGRVGGNLSANPWKKQAQGLCWVSPSKPLSFLPFLPSLSPHKLLFD